MTPQMGFHRLYSRWGNPLRHHGCIVLCRGACDLHSLRQLEPLQHDIAVGSWRTRPQQRHHLTGRERRRELPARLVPHREPLALQRGTDAPCESTVTVDQRHEPGIPLHLGLHTGRSPACLIFQIGSHMQLHGTPLRSPSGASPQAPCRDQSPHLQHETAARTSGLAGRCQGRRQGIFLEPPPHDQGIHLPCSNGAKQHIGRIGRQPGPGHGQSSHQLLHAQSLHLLLRIQLGPPLLLPEQPLVRRHSARHGGQLQSRLAQASGQPVGLSFQAALCQQAACRQQILRRIEAPVPALGHERPPLGCPVESGFEARHHAAGMPCRPLRTCHRHQLGIGQQNHAPTRVGPPVPQEFLHLLQEVSPEPYTIIRQGSGLHRVSLSVTINPNSGMDGRPCGAAPAHRSS